MNTNEQRMIDCFLPQSAGDETRQTAEALRQAAVVAGVCVLPGDSPLFSSATVRFIAGACRSEYVLVCVRPDVAVRPHPGALRRMVQAATDSGAGLLYTDRRLERDGQVTEAPLIDYQQGSLRDDFEFGAFLLFRSEAFRQAAEEMKSDYRYAGLYDLRLRLSRRWPVVHLPESLYTEVEGEGSSGTGHFDYVDPRNRAAQLEMEQACTEHLKAIGAYLPPRFDAWKPDETDEGPFTCEASVIIPVRNRARTIGDAIRSALGQKADFAFNVIVVDNYSTDGTRATINALRGDPRLVCLEPPVRGLGIGGCWNVAVGHPACGRFAVQLDSDDLYNGPNTLATIVRAFREQQCPMVVGAYLTTDFALSPIAPGLVDHREWTEENGRNNLLRVNGLGAPRAFYTPLLRRLRFPDTSYGEDYAVGLAMSRHYRIGRIFEPLYLCRRWEGNSDASPDVHTRNARNLYKDRLRTWELQARIRSNRQQSPLP